MGQTVRPLSMRFFDNKKESVFGAIHFAILTICSLKYLAFLEPFSIEPSNRFQEHFVSTTTALNISPLFIFDEEI